MKIVVLSYVSVYALIYVIQVAMNHVKSLALIVHTDVELIAKVIVILCVLISVVIIVERHVIHTVLMDVHQVVNHVAMPHVMQPPKAETRLYKINKGEKTCQ